MRYIVICILFLLVIVSCAGTPVPPVKTVPSLRIDTARIKNTEIRMFDGAIMKHIGPANNGLKFPHGISRGYHGVIFITKEDYYPDSIPFKATGNMQTIEAVPLKKQEYTDMGILYGTVCRAVTGGKLKEHTGIAEFYENEEVEVTQGILTFTAKTDENGVYSIELFPGEYTLTNENRQPHTFRIEAGKTTIVNIRKGLVLVD